ncbi:VOC family protein [Salsipaludibacter albus]|uniref:VOC family protein n=1 Tax=Salsipaludibacter albus TaxID=2849650 RepID=UPI001EE49C20|nr:VOC family protein [Salsipaludibacter albus]MBY5162638.1 VOC family protein [Salsipaludibacter albus]
MPDADTSTTTPPGGPVTELRLVLTVDDHARAVAFYRDQLGLEELAHHEERGGHVTILAAGRATLELNDDPYAEFIDEVEVGRRVPDRVRVAFAVPDSDDTTRRLVEAGARLVAPPTRTPWDSRNARLRDPEGTQLTLFTDLDGPDDAPT